MLIKVPGKSSKIAKMNDRIEILVCVFTVRSCLVYKTSTKIWCMLSHLEYFLDCKKSVNSKKLLNNKFNEIHLV